MNARSPDQAETREEIAAGWLARQRSGAMTAQEAQDFQVWLARDPANREALEHVAGVWRASAALRSDPQIMALRQGAMGRRYVGARRWQAGAAAAALLVAVFAGWGVSDPDSLPARALIAATNQQAFSTGVGQTAKVTLEDGTVVTLDTSTRLRAREADGKRLVYLDHGQAFFKVAHDPSRPFTVYAGDKAITALGTAFNVRVLKGEQVEVVLAEGKVKVTAAKAERRAPQAAAKAGATELSPGSKLVSAPDEGWRIAKVNVEQATSWRTGQLTFVRRPLGSVVEELNRYSERKVIIADAELAAAPITGGFPAGDVESFVAAVEGFGLARV
ncbi:MAG TPA: FecR domain-containing protein, partial [Caulobacteraceae bacterium]|nr:FecR domain-containing protein [Caulobacteraceae bacterium]